MDPKKLKQLKAAKRRYEEFKGKDGGGAAAAAAPPAKKPKLVRPTLPAYRALAPAQRDFVDRVLTNPSEHIFLTGEAGTGKSAALRVAIKLLQETRGHVVYVTGTTGVAATEIGGTTLAKFLKTGIRGDTQDATALEEIIKAIQKDRFAKKRLNAVTDLVIDEVSMMRAQYVTNMNTILQRVCESTKLFGGVRLIFCGDFCQLPPVVKGPLRYFQGPLFAFQAPEWKAANIYVHMLTFSHRQAESPEFAAMLSDLRMGRVTDEIDAKLRARVLDLPADEQMIVTHIYPLHVDTDRINEKTVLELPGELRTYEAITKVAAHPNYVPFKDHPVPLSLSLKMGAQVMLLRNMTRKDVEAAGGELPPLAKNEDPNKMILCNGSVGRVVRFEKAEEGNELVPIVRFERKGASSLSLTIERQQYEERDQDDKDKILATRSQLPLKLSYANTVHKSQGQTIDSVIMGDVGTAWEYGQAYVLLSRVRSLDQVYLISYFREAFRVHPDVEEFYNNAATTAAWKRV